MSDRSGSRQETRLLILDLDNTLYDWVGFFVPSFYAMVEVAADILSVNPETLLTDLQKIHRKYGNSEHPFALVETDTVSKVMPGLSIIERVKLLDPAFHEFNRKRKDLLKLFPDVIETLCSITATGCIVVAHTEAVVTNSLFRVQWLGLRPLLKRLYTPASRGHSHPDYEPMLRAADNEGFVRLLPSDHKKPHPEVIHEILADFSVSQAHAVYVGDSITRDIAMAINAGTGAAWAKYGTEFDRSLWQKLVRVTHWTEEDVAREARLRKAAEAILPHVELSSFRELLEFYSFGNSAERPRRIV